MDNEIIISVIMGVYNCKNKELLLNSIQSIINQTYPNWEFIICNDGSTDDTLDYLYNIEKLDDRIRIISYDKNHGLAHALNECIKCAKGEYIARQDDDDISYPDRFEKQIRFLKNNEEYAFVGTIADIYDDGGIWGIYSLEERPLKKSFLWNSPFLHPSVIFRKELFAEVGNYRVSWETTRAEDYDLFMRLYAAGYVGANIQEKLYKYRIVNGNVKHRKMKTRLQEVVVRAKGFSAMRLGLISIPYIVKPIIVGLIPQKILKNVKKMQYK